MRLGGRGRRAECTTTTSSREEVVAAVRLPMDIIEDEILCRLPVKSLFRCKCVCKFWYSVIKNPKPKFIKTHYQNNTTRPLFFERYPHQRFPVVFNPSAKTDYSIWPIPMVVNQNQNALSFFSYYLGLPFLGMFFRPVNGVSLIVLRDYDMYRYRYRYRMAMFNPATRQFLKLPLDDFEINTQSVYEHHLFGFGICNKYTTTTPHHLVYKVVWLNQLASQTDVAVAKVYTVATRGGADQDWRIINTALPGGYVGYYCNEPSDGVSINGKCYWLSKDLAHILVFDLDEEVFREMNSPLPSKYLANYVMHVLRSNMVCSEVRCPGKEHDSLALFVFETDFVHISVMDNEEEWLWIRYQVSYIDRRIGDLFDLNPLRLQGLLQSPITEAILLKAGEFSFALYSPKTNRCVRFVGGDNDYRGVSVFNFKESLFSIDGAIQVSDRVLEDFSTF